MTVDLSAPAPAQRSFLSSLTLRGAAVMALAYVFGRVGFPLPEGAVQDIAQRVVDLAFTFGAMAVSLGRARARAPLA